MNDLTGIPINYESLMPILEGVISTIFSFMPLFIGLVTALICFRLIPFLINKFVGH